MTTERDIEGFVLALVGAAMNGTKNSTAIMRERDENKRAALQKQSDADQMVAIESATKLVTILLCDIHRIADALEATQPFAVR